MPIPDQEQQLRLLQGLQRNQAAIESYCASSPQYSTVVDWVIENFQLLDGLDADVFAPLPEGESTPYVKDNINQLQHDLVTHYTGAEPYVALWSELATLPTISLPDPQQTPLDSEVGEAAEVETTGRTEPGGEWFTRTFGSERRYLFDVNLDAAKQRPSSVWIETHEQFLARFPLAQTESAEQESNRFAPDRLAQLRQLGSTEGPGEGSALVAQIEEAIDGVGNLVYPYSVLRGVAFLNRVAAQTNRWLSDGDVTPKQAAELLSAALKEYGTSMRVDQLPGSNVEGYLKMGYQLLRDTWGGLTDPEDRTAFVSENMNTDKYNYGRAIEGLGRAPKRNMSVQDMLMNQLHRNTNTNILGGPASAGPTTAYDQIQIALDQGPDAAQRAVRSSLEEMLGRIWESHYAKFKGEKQRLTLDAITNAIWAEWSTLLENYPGQAQQIIQQVCPDRATLRQLLDASLMLWKANGDLEWW